MAFSAAAAPLSPPLPLAPFPTNIRVAIPYGSKGALGRESIARDHLLRRVKSVGFKLGSRIKRAVIALFIFFFF